MKDSGILLHITSLNSSFGIGDFGEAAYKFADFLSKSGQTLWQILPIGYPGEGNSPYQCYSSKAINPYLIDPTEFIDMGLFSESFLEGYIEVGSAEKVDYNEVIRGKDTIFKRAFEDFDTSIDDYTKFKAENADWIDDFALFIVLLKDTSGHSISELNRKIIEFDPDSLKTAYNIYRYEIEREIFLQFIAFKQWFRLKNYVNDLGIKIIGDVPIYLSLDSVEVWTERRMFRIDNGVNPDHVSGVPPDKLSDEGQIWNNPLYDWRYHKKTGFIWWIDRISFALKKFDIIRLDHFRGFAKYYEIDAPFDDAHKGRWKKGPGLALFRMVNEIFDSERIIAEDLGLITSDVKRLIKKTGYAGMKVAQFGFDGNPDNEHLPQNYYGNYYVYTGTHDNNTLLGWYDDMSKKERGYLKNHLPGVNRENICEIVIDQVMGSDTKAAVIPMQDYLGLDGSARMNTPATLGSNWEWRMTGIPEGLDKDISKLTQKRRRNNGKR